MLFSSLWSDYLRTRYLRTGNSGRKAKRPYPFSYFMSGAPRVILVTLRARALCREKRANSSPSNFQQKFTSDFMALSRSRSTRSEHEYRDAFIKV